ncbi:DUF4232 domain-containing protein [Plantactinospora sp. BC1]|uniref:DUF4232 domain-containing protein n=1 Tax=Plantactinospora sp. BC1 TaxID=2108470 RepID=UPI000D17B2B0|nr:DUF4232 domain-containing protein [Plantactinospora sp. BC1]AVT34231.1 DUF4232 domain-containing protein [Plantactinospora sp. BC1]
MTIGVPPYRLGRSRRLGTLLGAVALLAACGTPSRPPIPEPTLTAEPAPTAVDCPDGFLITAGEVEPALGLRALGIELRNCGAAPYRLDGYPVVRVLDQERRPVDVTVGNGSAPVSAPDSYDVPPRPVLLGPGETARARVLWRNTVTESTEPATNASYLEIAPAPGAPTQLVAPGGGIDLGTTGRLAVNVWRSPAGDGPPASAPPSAPAPGVGEGPTVTPNAAGPGVGVRPTVGGRSTGGAG